MPSLIIGVLAVVIIAIIGGIILVIIGNRRPQTLDDQLMQSRLDEFLASGEAITLEEIEMSQPLSERVIYPMARRLGEFALRFTPQNALESTRKKLELSGLSATIDPAILLAAQFFLAVTFSGVVLFVFTIGAMKLPLWQRLGLAIVLGVLGFYFPQMIVQSRIGRRQKEVRKALPDALDLLTICVEAGLGFDAAMAKVAEKWDNELSLAFERVIQEVQLGKIRREALRTMAERLGTPELTSFVAAVIQSEQLGVSLSKVLRIQADQMRIKRRQLAEEEAHKAPIKMLVPMALLIFPSLMIVLLTPAGFKILNSAFAGMF